MQKFISLLVPSILLITAVSFAGICTSEMNKFENVSQNKKDQICGFFRDAGSFNEFQSCLFSTVKKFNKSITDMEIYKISDKNLSGVMSLCAGFSITGETPRNDPKRSTTGPTTK